MDDRSANEPDSEMKVLGALGGEWSQANAINNSGQVVGWASITNTSAEPLHAFLITPSNGLWKVPLY